MPTEESDEVIWINVKKRFFGKMGENLMATKLNRNINYLWIGILGFCLISCSQGQPATAIESTTTPSPTLELSTEPPLPTETPTQTPFPWPTSEEFYDGARITFINNAGFLITVGEKKILIDGLYDFNDPRIDPAPEVLQRAVNAQPPFDQIDLVIATHHHPDHFSADLVRSHLRNNEIAVFVSTREAVRQIERMGEEFDQRLISVDLEPGGSSHLSINGIELDYLYISHGDPSIKIIGVVITVDDYTFFHSGDMTPDETAENPVTLADLHGYGLHQKEIDLAFVPSFLFFDDEYLILIEDGIQTRYWAPMHYPYQYPPSGIERDFSNAVVFKDTLESWVVPLE